MRTRIGIVLVVVVMGWGMTVGGAEVTVKYLRAAIGSIPDRSRVNFVGDFSVAAGLKEARGTSMRGKGYSRFAVKDPEAPEVVFNSVYCQQDSKAFKALINATGDGRFHFYGNKEQGEDREEAIIVTDAKLVTDEAGETAESPAPAGPASYRIVMVDHVSSNKTVLANIELGKAYNVMGTTLTLEPEPAGSVNAPTVLR